MEMVECGASVKLFGQVIPLLPQRGPSPSATSDDEEHAKPKEMEGFSEAVEQKERSDAKPREPEEEGGGGEARKAALKKILPCPRCSSMDTKFCYYNNYNVKQPRHFCRDCQRYWTAGGTMRNVPVGAGRRKSKSFFADKISCRHVTISTAPHDVVDVLHSVVLPFPININGEANGDTLKQLIDHEGGKIDSRPAPRRNNNNIPPADRTRPPSTTVLISSDEQQVNKVDVAGNTHQQDARRVDINVCHVQPRPCWVYQWNIPAAGSYPIVFHPMIPTYAAPSPPSAGSSLGKHPRDENKQIPTQFVGNDSADKCDGAGNPQGQWRRRLWVPKSLGINDVGADEVARSFVSATVGTQKDEAGRRRVSHGGSFSPSSSSACPKAEEEMGAIARNPDAAAAVGANPVALARFLNQNECANDWY